MVESLNMVHEKSKAADHVTISLGYATIIPTKGDDPSILIKAADEALYKSKESGRNRATIANK
jgi:diguanylate cyclase (GGDEF)-like protein